MTEFRWLRLATPRNGPEEFAEFSSLPGAVLLDLVSKTFIICGTSAASAATSRRGVGGTPPEYTVKERTNPANSCDVGPINFHSPELESGSRAASLLKICSFLVPRG